MPLLVGTVWFSQRTGALLPAGLVLLASGEYLRLSSVRHIGGRSRTRTAEVGPLVTTGPYAYSRNPLYVANLMLWAGLGALSGHGAWAIALPTILSVHYSLVVRWEEAQLASRWGEPYLAYRNRTPRWIGHTNEKNTTRTMLLNWRSAFVSERSTLAILVTSCAAILVRGHLPG